MNPLPATSNFPAGYVPRHAQGTPLFRILQDHLETFLAEAEQGSESAGGFLRPEVRSTLEKYMECGILRFGFARIHCDGCAHEELLPLSCRFRGFCPSCHARRLAQWSDWVLETVLPDVRYRQWVLSWPKRVRAYFRYEDDLFRAFSCIVYDVLAEWMRTVLDEPDARPALVACDQTFGTLLDPHPHLHAMVSHGVFRPDGTFVEMTSVGVEDLRNLERVLASRLLTLLVRRGKLRPEDRKAMLSWPHLGFSLDASVGVRAGNREELRRLLCYIYRHPFRLEGVTYDEERGKVVYRAKRVHGLKGTDTQEFEPVEFIGALARHIPPPGKHQVRYYGAAHRDFRAEMGDGWTPPGTDTAGERLEEGRASWAKLIWRVYGVDPLICPKCGNRMRIISIIVHDPVVPKILNHLKLPVELPTLAPARRPGRDPPDEGEAGATSCPDEWFADEAPSIEDYLTDGPGWEEPAFEVGKLSLET